MPGSLIPVLLVAAGIIGFFIFLKVLKFTMKIAMTILFLGIAAAVIYFLLA